MSKTIPIDQQITFILKALDRHPDDPHLAAVLKSLRYVEARFDLFQLPTETVEKIRCLQREIALRRNVYPKWVATGRQGWTEEKAQKEIKAMEDILQDYLEPDLFRAATTPNAHP